MLTPALIAALWLFQAPAQTPKPAPAGSVHAPAKAHSTRTKPAEKPKPAGPKTAAELQADLTARMQQAPFAADQVNLAISGQDITLQGIVHTAEDKGLATREARLIAQKDGWTSAHVLNKLDVQLPHS